MNAVHKHTILIIGSYKLKGLAQKCIYSSEKKRVQKYNTEVYIQVDNNTVESLYHGHPRDHMKCPD